MRLLVSRLRRRLKEVYDNQGLTPSQVSVISRLSHDGPASTSDLAAAEGVRRQSMASTVAALEEQGVIHRQADPQDARRQLIVLSPSAVEVLEGSRQLRDRWLADVLQQTYGSDELEVIDRALVLLERIFTTQTKSEKAH
ncbi:marR family protein [Mycobacteroides abscessus MAB_082312_2258]|uniref:MarR family protein n=1 Tax=Mycobacteroides abscessus MAB_091912_2446 TaxID=1335414 RepID=A0A829M4T1_9MYCO|nr:marR family protein [Mycobacteroides abscessus MAB_082312_2258]ESV61090.1 marR family protein [Mycobacteroides abscessus MAB_091912_2446]